MLRIGCIVVAIQFWAFQAAAEVNFLFSGDVDQSTRQNIENGIEIGDDFFRRRLGVEIRNTIQVVASGSSSYLRANSPRNTYDSNCNGGFANPGIIVLCTQSEAFNRDQFSGGLRLQQEVITLHEYVHILQIELSRGQLTDPRWLTEGFAEYVVLLHKAETRQTNFRAELQHHARSARSAGLQLAALESRQGFNSSPWSSSLGMVACKELEDLAGLLSFRDYWLERGRGADWKTAFQTAFGVTVEEFYAEFSG